MLTPISVGWWVLPPTCGVCGRLPQKGSRPASQTRQSYFFFLNADGFKEIFL